MLVILIKLFNYKLVNYFDFRRILISTESFSECDASDVGNLIVAYVNVRQHSISLKNTNKRKKINIICSFLDQRETKVQTEITKRINLLLKRDYFCN